MIAMIAEEDEKVNAAAKKARTKTNAEMASMVSAGDWDSLDISSIGFVGGLCRMPGSHQY